MKACRLLAKIGLRKPDSDFQAAQNRRACEGGFRVLRKSGKGKLRKKRRLRVLRVIAGRPTAPEEILVKTPPALPCTRLPLHHGCAAA